MPAGVKWIQKIYCSFHLLEIFIKNIANMHRKHDVQAFPKHRQKHRRAMFLSEHRLNIPSLRIGKHRIVKNIPSLRKVKIPQPYCHADALSPALPRSNQLVKCSTSKKLPKFTFDQYDYETLSLSALRSVIFSICERRNNRWKSFTNGFSSWFKIQKW